jgi:hypothetical protein
MRACRNPESFTRASSFWLSYEPGRVRGAARLKKPVPAWLLILVLVLGVAAGFFASTMLNLAAESRQPLAPNFSIAITPPSMIVTQGNLSTFTVFLSSLNGFAGSVDLNVTVSPIIPVSAPALNPGSVSLFTGSGTASLTIAVPASTPIGTYTFVVVGTSGRLVHSVTAFLRVVSPPPPDFQISANPPGMNITRGASGTSTVTVSSSGGFSGAVTLSVSTSPSSGTSPTVSLSVYKITLFSGGSANALLTVTTSGITSAGSYSVLVQGVNGNLSHTVTVSVLVQ